MNPTTIFSSAPISYAASLLSSNTALLTTSSFIPNICPPPSNSLPIFLNKNSLLITSPSPKSKRARAPAGPPSCKTSLQSQRLLQALWSRHRSRLEELEERGFSPLFGCSLWCLRPEAFDVRVGLARVPARRQLSAGARNHRGLCSGLRGGHQRKNLRRERVRLLSVESGETWTCSLKTRSSSSPEAGRELARPSSAAARVKEPFPSSSTKTREPPTNSKKNSAIPARNAASSLPTSSPPKLVLRSWIKRFANLAASMSLSTTSA